MAVYNSNLPKIRKQIAASQAQMQKAIVHAEQRIKATKTAAKGSAEAEEREANRETLRDAKRVLKALDTSFAQLRSACCENDLSCNADVLGPAYQAAKAKKPKTR